MPKGGARNLLNLRLFNFFKVMTMSFYAVFQDTESAIERRHLVRFHFPCKGIRIGYLGKYWAVDSLY